MPSKLQLQLGTHRRRCVTSVESSMRKCCLRPSAVLEHFWASTPISFSFRCPWDFSTSTLRQHFCFSAGKRQQKNMEKPKQSTHRDLSSQGTLSMKTALGEDTTRQSNVQVLWDDMMIDVGIFGSYLIDSERKFMGFGSSNPHIALGFTQFLTVWYIYICLIQIQTCWEMRHDQIEEAHLGVDASRSCGEDFLTRHLNRFAMVCTCMNHMLTPQAPTCFASTPINLTWDPGTNDP